MPTVEEDLNDLPTFSLREIFLSISAVNLS